MVNKLLAMMQGVPRAAMALALAALVALSGCTVPASEGNADGDDDLADPQQEAAVNKTTTWYHNETWGVNTVPEPNGGHLPVPVPIDTINENCRVFTVVPLSSLLSATATVTYEGVLDYVGTWTLFIESQTDASFFVHASGSLPLTVNLSGEDIPVQVLNGRENFGFQVFVEPEYNETAPAVAQEMELNLVLQVKEDAEVRIQPVYTQNCNHVDGLQSR